MYNFGFHYRSQAFPIIFDPYTFLAHFLSSRLSLDNVITYYIRNRNVHITLNTVSIYEHGKRSHYNFAQEIGKIKAPLVRISRILRYFLKLFL